MAQASPWRTMEDSTRGPLRGIRVIDLTHARAGPTAVRHLADWGADVIRVERPVSISEDDIIGRRESSDFQNLHRNKRSLSLDLKSEEGMAIFRGLVADADVLIENMRPNVKFKLGIDYESLRSINPRLVYGSISGYGQEGPLASRGGVDQIAQGVGGLMAITGLPGQGPVRVGVPIADLAAGGYLAQGVLIALLERTHSGVGRWVQTSLIQAQIAMLDFQATRWLVDGEVPLQQGNDHPTGVPMGTYVAGDGIFINIAASSQVLWRHFCRAIDAPELVSDPRFERVELRRRHRAELREVITDKLSSHPAEHWVEKLNAAGVPCGPVNTIDKVFQDPQVQYLPIVQKVRHPNLGELSLVGQPCEISGYGNELHRPTPAIGDNNEEILAALGIDAEEVKRLRERKVI